MTIRDMIKEIKELHEGTVYYFGEEHTLPECDEFTVDVIDILEALEEYEVAESIEELYEDGYIADVYNYKGDNTYNWSAPINHNIDFRVYAETPTEIYIELAVHRFGDVRGNYTDYVVCRFDGTIEFYEALVSGNKFTTVEVDGEIYDCYVNAISECVEVSNADGEYICEAYGDIDDIKQGIKEAIETEC